MAYIGNPPAERYSSVSYQDLTGGTGTSFTLDYAVGSANEIEVFVNNVRQEPSVAYTVAGTALTMTGSIASTDDFYVVFQGKAIASGQVPEKQSDGSYVYLGNVDINGNELILDADADTKLYASTDDVVKMDIAGSEVFRFDSDGLKFNGDTAAANALDDYEEGTHQTTATASSSGTITLNATYDDFHYTKVGRLVNICGYIRVASVSSPTGIVTFSLPFAVASTGSTSPSVSIAANNLASGSVTDLWGELGGSLLYIYVGGSTSVAVTTAQAVQASTDFRFGFTYITT